MQHPTPSPMLGRNLPRSRSIWNAPVHLPETKRQKQKPPSSARNQFEMLQPCYRKQKPARTHKPHSMVTQSKHSLFLHSAVLTTMLLAYTCFPCVWSTRTRAKLILLHANLHAPPPPPPPPPPFVFKETVFSLFYFYSDYKWGQSLKLGRAITVSEYNSSTSLQQQTPTLSLHLHTVGFVCVCARVCVCVRGSVFKKLCQRKNKTKPWTRDARGAETQTLKLKRSAADIIFLHDLFTRVVTTTFRLQKHHSNLSKHRALALRSAYSVVDAGTGSTDLHSFPSRLTRSEYWTLPGGRKDTAQWRGRERHRLPLMLLETSERRTRSLPRSLCIPPDTPDKQLRTHQPRCVELNEGQPSPAF